MTAGGLPHSDISGSPPVYDSPKLFAVHHVLHRRNAPRHPPYVLFYLDSVFSCYLFACVAQSTYHAIAGPDTLIDLLAFHIYTPYCVSPMLSKNDDYSPEHLCRPEPRIPRRSLWHTIPAYEYHGDERDRTADPLLARQVLSQLSYAPDLSRQHRTPQRPHLSASSRVIRSLATAWAYLDLNQGPHAYQACALTTLSYRPVCPTSRMPPVSSTRDFLLILLYSKS